MTVRQFGGLSCRSRRSLLSNRGVPPKLRKEPVTPDKANTVLERIEIRQDAVDRISELLTPGSSLIISDYGISHETGRDTDFIVLTH